MGINWAAFAGGVASSAASSIEKRNQAERDAAMEERRMALAEKYQIKEEERTVARNKKKVAKEVADYGRGVAVLYNDDREILGERPLTPSEIEDRTLSVEASKLSNEDKRSSIDARAAESRRQDESLKLDRARTSATIKSLRGEGDGDKATDKKRGRVETVLNNIDARLKDVGAPPEERLAARDAVLKSVNQGVNVDQEWLDRYESNLYQGYRKDKRLDRWGADKLKREAAAAALKP